MWNPNKKKEKKEIIKEKPLTKEEKEKNYRELVIAQINYDREQEINNLLNKSSWIHLKIGS